ncbi:hypothetical protein, partial [Escherichia coli]|uniref:hypothetical protein n=1 Tax=Escherichia coli TaxID=562 RepID=UPI003F76B92A
MSKVFICAAIPDELATREEGAVAVATAIEAGDERRARAKFHWQFLEHYPAAQDCAYKFIVCEDKPGIPRPALMNPLMILVKIIKLRWIHILSYDQMVSRKINNQTT